MKKQKPIIIVVLVLVILLSTIFTASCATSAPSPKVPPKSNAIPKTKINQTHLTDENILKDLAACFGNLFYNVSEEKINSVSSTKKQVSVEATFKANIKGKNLRVSLIFNNDLDDATNNNISFKAEYIDSKEIMLSFTLFQDNPFIEERIEGEEPNQKTVLYYHYKLDFKFGSESSFVIPFVSDKKFIPLKNKNTSTKTMRNEINDSVNNIARFMAENLVGGINRKGEYYREENDDFYTRSYDITFDIKETFKKLAQKSRLAKQNPTNYPITPAQKQQIIDFEDAISSIIGINLTEGRTEFEIATNVVENAMPPATLRLQFEVKNIAKATVFGGNDVILKSFQADFHVEADEATKDTNFRFKGKEYNASFTMETFENTYVLKEIDLDLNNSTPVLFNDNYIIMEAEIKNFNSPRFPILNEKINNPATTTMIEVVSQYTPASHRESCPCPLFSMRLYNKNPLVENEEIEELFSFYIKEGTLYINALVGDNEAKSTQWSVDAGKNFIDDFFVEFNNYYKNKLFNLVEPENKDGVIASSEMTLISKFLTYFYANSTIANDSLSAYINIPLIAQTVFHKNPFADKPTFLHDDLFAMWSMQLGSDPESIKQVKFVAQGFVDGFFFDEKATFEVYSSKISDMIQVVESVEAGKYKILDDGADLSILVMPTP